MRNTSWTYMAIFCEGSWKNTDISGNVQGPKWFLPLISALFFNGSFRHFITLYMYVTGSYQSVVCYVIVQVSSCAVLVILRLGYMSFSGLTFICKLGLVQFGSSPLKWVSLRKWLASDSVLPDSLFLVIPLFYLCIWFPAGYLFHFIL